MWSRVADMLLNEETSGETVMDFVNFCRYVISLQFENAQNSNLLCWIEDLVRKPQIPRIVRCCKVYKVQYVVCNYTIIAFFVVKVI